MNRTFAKLLPFFSGSLLAALPIAVLTDTYLAAQRGWIAKTPAATRLVIFAAVFTLSTLAIALLVRPSRGWFLRHSAQLLAGCLSLCLAAAAAELVLPIWAPLPPFHLRQPKSVLNLQPDPVVFPGVPSPARITRNSLGLRGGEPEADSRHTAKILCIGGSTTESLYVDDPLTWPAQLEAQLNYQHASSYWIANAGHSDYGVAHHNRLLEETPRQQYDIVVLLVGISDLMRYLLALDTGEHAPPAWYRSALASLARDVWNGRLGHGMCVDPTGAAYQHARGKLRFPRWPGPADFAFAAAGYQNRLRHLIHFLNRRGTRAIFITQPVLWDSNLSAEAMRRLVVCRMFPHPLPGWRLDAQDLRGGIDLYNTALRQVCRETGTPLLDAAASMNGNARYFYDDYHLNVEGGHALAELVANAIGGLSNSNSVTSRGHSHLSAE